MTRATVAVAGLSAFIVGICLVWVGRSVWTEDQVGSGWVATMAGFVLGALSVPLGVYSLWLTVRLRSLDADAAAVAARKRVVMDLPDERPIGTAPSTLLLPQRRALAFKSRTMQLEQLRNWCTSSATEGRRFFYLSGPALTGKTRLIDELAAELRKQGWLVGRLIQGHEADAWPATCQVPGPQLLVVEVGYASPSRLDQFLEEAVVDTRPGPRVLLAGRSRTLSLGKTDATKAALDEMSRAGDRVDLPVLGEVSDQTRWYDEVAATFAADLGVPAQRKTGWKPEESTEVGLVQARALAWALGQVALGDEQKTTISASIRGVGQVLADSEMAQWPPLPFPHSQSLPRRCFTAAYLLDAHDRDSLSSSLSKVRGLSEDLQDDAVTWLLNLYPEGTARFQAPPDLVSVAIVLPVVTERPGDISALVGHDPVLVAGLAGRLLSATDLYPEAAGIVITVLDAIGRPLDELTLSAVLARTRAGNLIDVLLEEDLTRRPPHDTTALLSQLDRRDDLIRTRIAVRRQHISLCRHGSDLDELARALRRHAPDLHDMGRDKEALTVVEEAVALLRDAARANPDQYNPDLGDALGGHSRILHALGRDQEGLTVVEEAVALLRDAAAANPDQYNPHLGQALDGHSRILRDMGRYEPALTASEQAVALFRDAAAANPDRYNPDLGQALGGHSRILHHMGRYEQALTAIQEAVALFRDAAATNPDQYNPPLGQTLDGHSRILRDMGRYEQALTASEQAVALLRDAAATNPDRYNPDLGQALDVHSRILHALGRYQEALTASGQAMALMSDTARAASDQYNPPLGQALGGHSRILHDMGRYEPALTASEQAVALFRDAAATNPDRWNPNLGDALDGHSRILCDMGRYEQALTPIQEAVALFRDAAATNPDQYNPYLGQALDGHSRILHALGQYEEALTPSEQAVALLRDAATTNPDRWNPNLGDARRLWRDCMTALGREDEIVTRLDL